MLDSLKNSPKLYKLWQARNKIQKQTESIFSQHEEGDNVVLVRGDKKIEKITIDGEERKDIKEFLNEAMKKLDKKLEKEMQSNASEFMDMLK